MDLLDDVLDQIYEAALLPELWPQALARLDSLSGTTGGVIFVGARDRHAWAATDNFRETITAFVAEGWMLRNPRISKGIALNHPGFTRDSDFLSEEERANEPVYREFMYPRGCGASVGTAVPIHTGEMVVISFEQDYRRGPVPGAVVAMLDQARPHLARAAIMAARLHLEQLKSTVSGLDAIGLPAAVAGADQRVLASGASFSGLAPALIARAFGRLALAHGPTNALLVSAIDEAARGHAAPRSIPMPAGVNHDALVIHVLPLRRQAHDLFRAATALVIAMPVRAPAAPPFDMLNTLFDLTPAEARLAQRLTQGLSLKEIAGESGVTVETARTHLKTVLRKSGMHRQAELVGFLAGIGRLGIR